jgi:hypothetical protein
MQMTKTADCESMELVFYLIYRKRLYLTLSAFESSLSLGRHFRSRPFDRLECELVQPFNATSTAFLPFHSLVPTNPAASGDTMQV